MNRQFVPSNRGRSAYGNARARPSGHRPSTDQRRRRSSSPRKKHHTRSPQEDDHQHSRSTSISKSPSCSPAKRKSKSPKRKEKSENVLVKLGEKLESVVIDHEEILILADKELNEEIEKLGKTLCKAEHQNLLEKFYGELKDLAKEKLDYKMIVFGSILSDLYTNTSDIDICVVTDTEDVGEVFGKIRNLIKFEYGRKCLLKNELRIGAKVPILDIEMKWEGKIVRAQFSINNFVGIRNSVWLWLLSNLFGLEKFRNIFTVIKVWATQANIKDSTKGTFSSYSLALLLVVYLQHTDPQSLPNILKFVRDDLEKDFYEMEDMLEHIENELEWEKLEINEIEIVAGFFKFYGDLDLRDFVIWPEVGIFAREEGEKLKARVPVKIIEPFNQNNVGKCVSLEGYERIRMAFKKVNEKIYKGLEDRNDLSILIGLNVEESTSKVDQEVKNLENLGLEEKDKGVEKMETDNVETDKPNEDVPVEQATTPSKKKGKKSFITHGITYSIPILCILGLLVNNCLAITPMVCHKTQKGNFIKFEVDPNECTQITKILNNSAKNDDIEIFKPNLERFVFNGWRCLKIEQKIWYRTDFLNYRHQKPPEQKMLKVSSDDCNNWINFRKCESGNLVGNDEMHTENILEPNYSYFKFGWQFVEAINCFLTKVKLIGKPGVTKISSLTEEVEHCDYKQGHCALSSGSIIVWNKTNDIENIYDSRFCTYKSAGVIEGNYTQGIWYSQDTQRALVFDKNSPKIETCGRTLRISNTGLAVKEMDFKLIMGENDRKKRNAETENLSDKCVSESELFSRLQASAIFENKQARLRLEKIIHLICKSVQISQKTASFLHLDPTNFIREKFDNPFFEGAWVDNDIIEFWPCNPVNYTLRKMTDGKCYKDLPINITLGMTTKKAFLNTLSLIVKADSEVGECEKYRFLTIKLENKLFRVDQWTSEIKVVNEIKVEKISMNDQNLLSGLELHILAKDSLNKLKEEQVDLIQLLHPFLGTHRAFDALENDKNVQNRGNWFSHLENSEFSLGNFISNYINFRECFEMVVCIFVVLFFLYKLYLWNQERVTRKVIKNVSTEEQLKTFRGSVAEATKFVPIQMPAKESAENEFGRIEVEECANVNMPKQKRKRWY